MKSSKILLALLVLLSFNVSNAQYSSALKSVANKISRNLAGEVLGSTTKKVSIQGVKKIPKESYDLGLNKVSKEFIRFTTQKSFKEVSELIKANSKNSITKTLTNLRIQSLGAASSIKVLRNTSSKVLKIAIGSDLKSYASKNGFKLVANKRSISVYSQTGENLGRIYQNGNKKVVNVGSNFLEKSINSKTRYFVNPILDVPLPNAIYKVENMKFVTDKYSKTILAEAKSFPKNVVNRENVVKGKFKRSLNGGFIGDHDGHLIAHSLGGNYGKLNLVSQNGSLNIKQYASIENFIRGYKSVVKNYSVKPSYIGKGLRPQSITQNFEFRGGIEKLSYLIKVNPNMTYKKAIDANGKEFFNCTIKHINNKKTLLSALRTSTSATKKALSKMDMPSKEIDKLLKRYSPVELTQLLKQTDNLSPRAMREMLLDLAIIPQSKSKSFKNFISASKENRLVYERLSKKLGPSLRTDLSVLEQVKKGVTPVKLKTINNELLGKQLKNVKYVKKKVSIDGVVYEGVFLKANEEVKLTTVRLSKRFIGVNNDLQFQESTKLLKKEYLKNPEAFKKQLISSNKRTLKRDKELFEKNKVAILDLRDKINLGMKNGDKDLVKKSLKELRKITKEITFIRTSKEKPFEMLEMDEIIKTQIKDIEFPKASNKGRVFGFVWHHKENKGTMELIEKYAHDVNKHTGGNALWNQGIR